MFVSLVRIEADNGIITKVTVEDGVGWKPERNWAGWPVRSYAFRSWLYRMYAEGAKVRYNDHPLQVRIRGMFRRVRTKARCACGCKELIAYGRWVPNHGPPYWKEDHFVRTQPGVDHRFTKGFTPWNKGMKGLRTPGSEKGWFRKGERRGAAARNWNGGFWKPGGYLYRRSGNPDDRYPSGGVRYINVAREALEEKIGRALKPWEVAWHVNGDQADNRPENLEAVSRGESARRTSSKRWGVRPKKEPVRDEYGDVYCTTCRRWFASESAYERHPCLAGR